jgi:hypothetical protein
MPRAKATPAPEPPPKVRRRPRDPATCHPDRPEFCKGICAACYYRDRRERAGATPRQARPILALLQAEALEVPRDPAHAIAIAQRELLAGLPEAARALRRVIVEGDIDKGYVVKAAAALLRGVSVPGGVAGLRRLLEEPAKPVEGPPPAQIVIGLHVAAGDVQVGRVVGTVGPAPRGDLP